MTSDVYHFAIPSGLYDFPDQGSMGEIMFNTCAPTIAEQVLGASLSRLPFLNRAYYILRISHCVYFASLVNARDLRICLLSLITLVCNVTSAFSLAEDPLLAKFSIFSLSLPCFQLIAIAGSIECLLSSPSITLGDRIAALS